MIERTRRARMRRRSPGGERRFDQRLVVHFVLVGPRMLARSVNSKTGTVECITQPTRSEQDRGGCVVPLTAISFRPADHGLTLTQGQPGIL